ncbi:MAG TPA: type II secretion system protein GspM [Rhizomicrobium sp.]|jgi:general secretion pathway protein M
MRGRGWSHVLLIALATVLVIAIGVPVVESFIDQSDEIAESKTTLIRLRGQIAAKPRLERELAEIDSLGAATASLLRGGSEALAAANMQNAVKGLVERHGGQVRSAQNLPSAMLGALQRIQVQYELSLPLGSLPAVTYELETSMPYLFLNDVDIRAEKAWGPGGTSSGVPNLHVLWTVSGYRWAGTR